MHWGSVRPFGSVACAKKLRIFQLFRQRRIRRPIRSWLCKYTRRVSWTHFAITSRKKQKKSGRYILLKKCGMIGLFFSHLLFVSSFGFISTHRFIAGSDVIGCNMRLQRLVPYTSDTPSVIRRQTHVVWTRCHSFIVVQRITDYQWSVRINPHSSGRKWLADDAKTKTKKLCPLSGLSRIKYSGWNVYYRSCLGYLAHFESPLPAHNGWLWEYTNLSLKRPWTFVFRNVQLNEWLVVFGDVPNQVRSEIQFLSCFIWHFINPIETETRLETETDRGCKFGCSLFAWFSVVP